MAPATTPLARVIVDSREPKNVDALLQAEGATVERRELDVGDYVIQTRDDANAEWKPKLIVERKTFYDLIGSIKDKRLWEQHGRLTANAQGARVAYLVEQSSIPDPKAKTGKMLNKAAEAALLKLGVIFKTQLLRSRNIQHTAWTLAWSAKRLGDLKEGEDDPTANYRVTVHASKRENRTARGCWEGMLECVPGVGPEVAKAVADEFETPNDFFALFAKNADEKALAEIKVNGKRRVGDVLANKIYEHMGFGTSAPSKRPKVEAS